MTTRNGVLVLLLLLSASPLFAQSPQACDGLRTISLANATVTTAVVVSGSFTPPGATNPNVAIGNLPAFCRVAATLKPKPDSVIIAEHSTNGVVDRRQPLCSHPQVAAYSGTGSLDDAASFTCK